ncbi:hypothetical protein [Paenibacillus sp. LjRoot153]|uniref:hypothetical protein n=1 Tax=Paenibacillus sp. LjRoot153 TaxID=3342270 RepID=UPI003F4FDFFD
MLILNIVLLFICIGIVYTLQLMGKIFQPIEKITYYMVIVIAIEQLHSAIFDNFSLFEFSETLSSFFFYKLNQLIVMPIATMWLLFSFYNKTRFLNKMLFLGLWFFGLTGLYVVFHYLGVLKITDWNFGYSIVVWYVVLVESLCFSLLFRKMLRKCDNCDTIPT